jgi:ubiquinone/menaquinone biosynthesis C-methylase UbiE
MGRKMAQPMSYQGADWLERPNRDEEQQPEHVLDVLGVKDGQSVADVGCGSGYFTAHLSRRVGARGRVYASDLQIEMLDLLAKRVEKEHLRNVTPIHADPNDAKLPAKTLDVILLVDVYHELPNPPATLAQFRNALAANGRLALVEYRAEDPKVEIKPEHKTTLEQLKREFAANHWTFVSSDESLPQQRIVQFTP